MANLDCLAELTYLYVVTCREVSLVRGGMLENVHKTRRRELPCLWRSRATTRGPAAPVWVCGSRTIVSASCWAVGVYGRTRGRLYVKAVFVVAWEGCGQRRRDVSTSTKGRIKAVVVKMPVRRIVPQWEKRPLGARCLRLTQATNPRKIEGQQIKMGVLSRSTGAFVDRLRGPPYTGRQKRGK